jgi:anti-anti-sigma factor
MNTNNTFTVTPLNPAPGGVTHGFALAGAMDAHCAPALAALADLEPGSAVVLDFALVSQVNSMGLAQFLRLLEAWKSRGVRTEVANVNRMTSILFKMTGLNRYFGHPASPAARPAAPGGGALPRSAGAAVPPPVAAVPDGGDPAVPDRLSFQVCAQSIQQMNGWFFCNNYLQRKLERGVRINVAPPALTFDPQAHEAHLMFVKPFDACHLLRRRGYRALVRPLDEPDEVVVVARAADTRLGWEDFAGARVATAFRDSFVYLLGRYLCDESGVDSARLSIDFTGNEIKGLMQLLRGQVDLVFMLHKTYRELSDLSRRDTRVLEASQTQFAYHMLCVSPQAGHVRGPLLETLTGMADDPAGAGVLKELDMRGWVPVAPEEIEMLALLYDRYGTGGEPRGESRPAAPGYESRALHPFPT